MAENVLVDSQFSLATVLRPYRNFETVMQGQPPTTPIPFFSTLNNGERPFLDPDAGRDGFAPGLMRYVGVPLGARVLLWFPLTIVEAGEVIVIKAYRYCVHSRLRNVTDFRNRRTPFHLKRQFPGQPDTATPGNQLRFVIPGATRSVIYTQPEPALTFQAATQVMRRELLSIQAGGPFGLGDPSIPQPPLPGGLLGDYQQGVLDPADFPATGAANLSLFVPYWFDAEGDQLLVTAQKTEDLDTNWDFTSAADDLAFSEIYGTGNSTHPEFDDIGIYMMVGTNL